MKQFNRIRFEQDAGEKGTRRLQVAPERSDQTRLRKRDDILPFFAAREQLIALMGTYNPKIENVDRIATEFDIFGDHAADLAVGDTKEHQYCFVEFQRCYENKHLQKEGKQSDPRMVRSIRSRLSQIIDWILWLENQKHTVSYTQRFGVGEIQFVGLLVVGRDRYLTEPSLKQRLTCAVNRWLFAAASCTASHSTSFMQT